VNKRLPDDALAFYIALGPSRTQRQVADHFGVGKRTVAYRAKKENWLRLAAEADRQSRESALQRAQETNDEMRIRHEKAARFAQMRALEALKNVPITNPATALRALDIGLRHERLARGESEQTVKNDIAEILRDEHKRFLTAVEGGGDA